MSTTSKNNRVALGIITNIPEQPRTFPAAKKSSLPADADPIVPQPLVDETQPIQKKIYTRQFLLNLRSHPRCQAPHSPAPAEIIRLYDEEHEQLRRAASVATTPSSSTSSSSESLSPPVIINIPVSTQDALLASKPMFSPAPVPTVPRVPPSPSVSSAAAAAAAIASLSAFSPVPYSANSTVHVPSFVKIPFSCVDDKETDRILSKSSTGVLSPIGTGKQLPIGSSKPKPDIAINHSSDSFLTNHMLSPFLTQSPGQLAAPPNTPMRPSILPSPSSTMSLFHQAALGALSHVSSGPATPLSSVVVSPPLPSFVKVSPPPTTLTAVAPAAQQHQQHNNNHNYHHKKQQQQQQPQAMDVMTARMNGILRETDARRLTNRQKQIDYGKATEGYRRYLDLVPRPKRRRDDPKTPNKNQICSKRSWDGQIRKWRRLLHQYDPVGTPMPDDNNLVGVDTDTDENEGDREDAVDESNGRAIQRQLFAGTDSENAVPCA